MSADAAETVCITAVPAIAMGLGSAAVSMGEPSDTLQARLQHFSAGLLIGAVITEIFPILRQRLTNKGSAFSGLGRIRWANLFAAFVGFVLALLLMYGMKALDDDDDDGGESEGDDGKGEHEAAAAEFPETPKPMAEGHSHSRRSSAANDEGTPKHVWQNHNRATTEEGARIRIALARLQRHSTALSQLIASDAPDQEAVDEQVHGIDFLVDSARRLVRGAEPIDTHNKKRLRHHAAELNAFAQELQRMDLDKMEPLEKQLSVIGDTLRHIHSHAERATFRRWAPAHVHREESFEDEDEDDGEHTAAAAPRGLIVAVVVDSVVDGMLIGLASAVAATGGWLMAVATALEMGFLGYSYACSIVKAVRWRTALVAVLALPPGAMMCASLATAVGATALEHSPAFCGLIAFSLVALLFLVLQELLIEAHEKEGGEVWHVRILLYVGLVLSVALDVLLG